MTRILIFDGIAKEDPFTLPVKVSIIHKKLTGGQMMIVFFFSFP